jgi:hypothetical protein
VRNSVTHKAFWTSFTFFCPFILLLFHLMALFLCSSYFLSLVSKTKLIVHMRNKNTVFWTNFSRYYEDFFMFFLAHVIFTRQHKL